MQLYLVALALAAVGATAQVGNSCKFEEKRERDEKAY